MPEDKFNHALTRFADGRAGLTLTMSKDGFWLRQGVDQWPISGEQVDKVLIAMRSMRVA